MKIGILQAGHFPDTLIPRFGDYDQIYARMLRGHGFEFQTWPEVDMTFPADAGAADGWLIPGSRHGAYEDLPWIAPLEELIRDIAACGRPLVGICFGHQIIARALGGQVAKFADGWAVGATEYLAGGEPLTLNAWHQDQVTRRPDGARVLASNAFCENAMLGYGNHIWTVQAHPEFDATAVEALIRGRGRGAVPDAVLEDALARLDWPDDNDKIAARIAAFLKKERA